MSEVTLDEVGPWTEIKLKILGKYASAYTTIMRNQRSIRHCAYIDAFAGAGTHTSKASGEEIDGTPLIALRYPFNHYYFIELDSKKASRLRELAGQRDDVTVLCGDTNSVLPEEVLPKWQYKDYRRALCLFDPYDLNPVWPLVEQVGSMGSIDMFLNFMVMDANRNILWANPDCVAPSQIKRMDAFWGDNSWKKDACEDGLFGDVRKEKSYLAVVQAYALRLKKKAGFRFVPDPLPVRIGVSRGAVIYYLFFASHNSAGSKIAEDIFKKYR